MQYVYILICSDNKSYIGCTNNLKSRIERHNKGYVPATKDKLPVKLYFYAGFNNKTKAYEFEKYLKTASGRSFLKNRIFG